MDKHSAAWSRFYKDIMHRHPLSDDEWKRLQEITYIREIRRGEYFSKQGKVMAEAGFLCQGHFKSISFTQRDKESILALYLPETWVCDLESFVHGTTARMSLQALTDSVLICFNKRSEHQICTELPGMIKYFLRIHQDYIIYLQHKLSIMQYGNARNKYEYFLAMNYGELIPHLTQRQIAAYLGITPEFLSVQRSLEKKSHKSNE